MSSFSEVLFSKLELFSNGNSLFDCSNVVVGLSGGPDSVMLLLYLKKLQEKNSLFPKITAVHVNHMYREDAGDDELFCKNLCEKLNIPLKIYRFDVAKLAQEKKKSFEEMGRILRYECFDNVSSELENARIAVAHHRDDVAETMLMNLFRGSGIEGLTTPKAVSGNIIRPLITISKEEILKYLSEENVSYCVDYTNSISDTTRNKWRNEILPMISEVSVKEPSLALMDVYELLSDDLSLIEDITDEVYLASVREVNGIKLLKAEAVLNQKRAISSRLIRRLWNDTFGNLVDFTKVHVDSVLDFVFSSTSGTGSLDLPFKRTLIKNNGELFFVSEAERWDKLIAYSSSFGPVFIDYELNEFLNYSKTANLPNTSIHIGVDIIENTLGLEYNNLSWLCPFDDDSDLNKLSVRNRITSETFRRAGSDSGKKLGKLLSDMHIPKETRDLVIGVFLDGELMWVPGIGHTAGFLSGASYEAWSKENASYNGKFLRVSIEVRGEC